MITFEYECWKCPEWHKDTATGRDELIEFMQVSGAATRIIED